MAHYRDHEGLQVVPDRRGDDSDEKQPYMPVLNEADKEAYISQEEKYRYSLKKAYYAQGLEVPGALNDSQETLARGPPSYTSNQAILGGHQVPPAPPSGPHSWWRRRRTILAVVAIVLVILAIAIPVTVLETRRATMNVAPPPASPDASQMTLNRTPSTSGAFDGTGIASIVPTNSSTQVYTYFQHFDGAIRQATMDTNGNWAPSSSSDTLVPASNVLNGTPIAAETYPNGSDTVWHVVYLDRNRILQDVTMINGSEKWQQGTLGQFNFKASASPTSGLAINPNQVGGFPGEPPILGDVQVAYGGTDSLVHLVTLNANSSTWTETHVFPSFVNGDAGFGMSQPNQFTWFFYIDRHTSELNYQYLQTFPNTVGDWQNAPEPAPLQPRPNSSVSVAQFSTVAIQDVTGSIITVGTNSADPTGPWLPSESVGIGMPLTRINSRFTLNNPPVGMIFFQFNGSDVGYHQQTSGGFSTQNIPIPS